MAFSATKLVEIRRVKGWTQAEAVETTGIPMGTYRDLEQGKTQDPALSTLQALSKAFGVAIEDFINGNDAPQPMGRPKGKFK